VRITHVFFDVHDVLVDRAQLGRCYAENVGRIMAQRYGLTPEVWAQANREIVADWDSYYTDLNLSGEDGIAHMWEGVFRTTRALFRLTGAPEPPKAELTALSRELPGLAATGCAVLYPEVPEVLAALDHAGVILGVISHSLDNQIRASLAPVLHHFKGTIWSADYAGRFDKDVQRYQIAAAHTTTAACLVVDDKPTPLLNARRAGMQTLQICRNPDQSSADSMLPDLRGLVDYCLRVSLS
jgi:FMN phosphatase YigB (HAD superfamily)